MLSFDVFQKAQRDFKVTSVTGGLVTVCTVVLISILVLFETFEYLSSHTTESMGVDRSFGGRIIVNIDMTFPNSACRFVNFDVVDSTGEEQIAVNDIQKESVPNPNAKLKQGCHVHGQLHAHKVASNFHFALGKGVPNTALGSSMSTDPFAKTMVGAQHQHRFDMYELKLMNMSHYINRLSFGNEPRFSLRGRQPQPLEGLRREVASGLGQYNYYLSVVPTVYIPLHGRKTRSYQYSYTEKVVEVEANQSRFPHPGVFFYLSISPLVVRVTEQERSFLHFITNLLAIVGSVWVVAGAVAKSLRAVSGGGRSNDLQMSTIPSSAYNGGGATSTGMRGIAMAAPPHKDLSHQA